MSTSCKSTTREKTSEGAEDDLSWWAVEKSKAMTANKNPFAYENALESEDLHM